VWEEGDESYHQELMVPALLIYGAQDKFVTLEEEQWMQEVSDKNNKKGLHYLDLCSIFTDLLCCFQCS